MHAFVSLGYTALHPKAGRTVSLAPHNVMMLTVTAPADFIIDPAQESDHRGQGGGGHVTSHGVHAEQHAYETDPMTVTLAFEPPLNNIWDIHTGSFAKCHLNYK